MKRTLVKTAVVVGILAFASLGYLVYTKFKYVHEIKVADAITESHVLFIDDISKTKAVTGLDMYPIYDEFESAFALEPACKGLTLFRYSRTGDLGFDFLKHPVSYLYISDLSKLPPYSAGYANPGYVVSMSPVNFNGVEVSFDHQTVQNAVHSTCFVASGKGGR